MKPVARTLALLLLLSPGATRGQEPGTHRVHTIQVANATPFYSPGRIVAAPGDSVVWASGALADVHAIHVEGGLAASPALEPGTAWGLRFAREGSYTYRCRIHPWMVGQVEVRAPAAALRTLALPQGFGPAIDLVPDGAGGAWVVEGATAPGLFSGASGRLVHVAPDGKMEEAHIESPKFRVHYLGADARRLWFLEPVSGALVQWARAPEGGSVRLFAERGRILPPWSVDAAGTAWSAGARGGVLRSVPLDGGEMREWPLADSAAVLAVVPSAGSVWAVLAPGDRVARLDPATGRAEVHPLGAGSSVAEILPRADGELWFTDGGTRRIGRLRGGWTVDLPTPTPAADPAGLVEARGPAGGVWFVERGPARLARVHGDAVQELALPAALGAPALVRVDEVDGTVWVIGGEGRRVGRLGGE